MHPEADRELRPELSNDEKLLWSGQPRSGVRLRFSDLFLIPFSLIWGGFAIFWEWTVLQDDAPLLFRLWGIPFVLIGLYFIFGRFVVDAWQRRRTYYGLTNERALIVSGLFHREVKSVSLRGTPEITLSERADRSGTITFGAASGMPRWLASSSWSGAASQGPPSFEMIENARQVYGQIQSAQRSLNPVRV